MDRLSQLVRWKLLTVIALTAAGCVPPAAEVPDPDNGQTPPADSGPAVIAGGPRILLAGLGDSVSSESVQLTWSQVVGAQYYRVSFGRDADPAFLINVQTNQYAVQSLSSCADYYWKIEAVTQTATVDSEVGWFKTACPSNLPAKPRYPTPSNEDFGVVTADGLQWQASPTAESYEVYFGPNPDPPFLGSASEPRYAALPTLAAGAQYHWRVVAKNRFGQTTSPTWTFRVTNNLTGPGTPRFLEPNDDAIRARTRITLRWTRSTDATEYDVYLGPDATAFEKRATTQVGSYEIANLSFATRYFWQIVARGPSGETRSPVWSFTTAFEPQLPVVVDRPSPTNNTLGADPQTAFSWRTDADTDEYDVYLGANADTPVRVGTVARPPFRPAAPLQGGREYSWYVVARNAQGEVAGPTWRFLVRNVTGSDDSPPDTPDDGGPTDPSEGPTDPPATGAPPITSFVGVTRQDCTTRYFARPADRLDMSDDGRFFVVDGVRVVDHRNNGEATLVSVSTSGTRGTGSYPSLSGNARFVAFESPNNLAPDDNNTYKDVYVHDRQTGVTRCLTPGGNERSGLPSISSDGRFVSFASWASNLTAGDDSGTPDIYVASVETGALQRLTNGGSLEDSAISGNGRYVAYSLTGGGVWFHDRQSGTRTRIADSGFTYARSMADDGSAVAITGRWAGSSTPQVFVARPFGGASELASVAPDGSVGDLVSWLPTISGDGRYVFYSTLASNLGPPNGVLQLQIFRFDRQARENLIVSARNQLVQGNGLSFYSGSSRDGKVAVFDSTSTNLVAGDPEGVQVFVSECLP